MGQNALVVHLSHFRQLRSSSAGITLVCSSCAGDKTAKGTTKRHKGLCCQLNGTECYAVYYTSKSLVDVSICDMFILVRSGTGSSLIRLLGDLEPAAIAEQWSVALLERGSVRGTADPTPTTSSQG